MMTMVVVSCRSVMRASDDDKSINIIMVEAAAAAAAAGYDEEDVDDAMNKKMRCLHVCSYYLEVLFLL